MCLMTACAGSASAVSAALALAIVLGCWNLHGSSGDIALLSLNDASSVAASLLDTLGLVSAVAVVAGARHGY